MDLPTAVPEEKRALIEQAVSELAVIKHVEAVVLGGSYASGTAHSGSDLDIGVYYLESQPFAVEEIRQAAQRLARPGSTPTVTGFYEWGAWVNGGAWIETPVCKVDFLYRSLDQVRKTIDESHQGICRHDYDQQPTFGYYSTGYLAETMICLPLFDPARHIARLKEAAAQYPPRLKASIIQNSLWSAEFTLAHAKGFAEKGDIYNTSGCLARIAANLTQALFALNECYFLTDKKVMEAIEAFKMRPPEYCERLQLLLAYIGTGREELIRSVTALDELWREVKALAADAYTPRY